MLNLKLFFKLINEADEFYQRISALNQKKSAVYSDKNVVEQVTLCCGGLAERRS